MEIWESRRQIFHHPKFRIGEQLVEGPKFVKHLGTHGFAQEKKLRCPGSGSLRKMMAIRYFIFRCPLFCICICTYEIMCIWFHEILQYIVTYVVPNFMNTHTNFVATTEAIFMSRTRDGAKHKEHTLGGSRLGVRNGFICKNTCILFGEI